MTTHHRPLRVLLIAVTLLGALRPAAAQTAAPLPADHRTLTAPVTLAQLDAVLAAAGERDWITVVEESRSAGGLPIPLVHVDRSHGSAPWRVLLVAGEHGDEPAGVAALTYLIRDLAGDAARLGNDVELWIMPVLNPDGVAAGTPGNGGGADLARDHLLLAQPETRALHDVARRVQPAMVVNLAEFDRTPDAFRARGLEVWPNIMVGTADAVLLDPGLYTVESHWVDAMAAPLAAAGHAFARLVTGGPPPYLPQRPASLAGDTLQNSLAAATGCLAFVVSSGVRRASPNPNADIGRRVDAQLRVLDVLLKDPTLRAPSLAAVAAARSAPLPPFLPTDTFWANAGPRVSDVTVMDSQHGAPVVVSTANLMLDRIVADSVATPVAWAVAADAAAPLRALLDRHGITYQVLGAATVLRAERSRLLRVEEAGDEGTGTRQIVTREAAADRTFQPGALLVFPDQPARVLAALLLEPAMRAGIFRDPRLRATVADDGTIPVWRVTGVGQ